MTTDNGQAQPLSGCEVLPPMESEAASQADRSQGVRRTDRLRARDRFSQLNAFVDFTMQTLKAAEIRVWLVLYRDTRDGIAATAQAQIASRAGISVRAVHGAVKRLERLGLLKIVYRGGLNRGPSRYRVLPLI